VNHAFVKESDSAGELGRSEKDPNFFRFFFALSAFINSH
jgi:hypothetical protein